jgi:hypothetical protein
MSREKAGRGAGDPLTWGAVVLTAAAFAGSYTHTQTTVATNGVTGWMSWVTAGMPELMVLLAVVSLKRGRRDAWTLTTLGTASAFTIAANLAQAEHSAWGYVVAGWPALAAILSTGMFAHGKAKVRTVSRREPSVSRREPTVSPAEPTGLTLVPDTEPMAWLRAHADEPVAAQAQALGLSVSTVKRLRAQLRAQAA